MKFNFKIQQYQTEAVDAVVNVFSGQGFHDKTSYIRDLGTLKRQNSQIAINLDDDEEDIYDNGGFKNVLYPDIEVARDLCEKHLMDFHSKGSGKADEELPELPDDLAALFGDLAEATAQEEVEEEKKRVL